ncbi:MAG: S8 family serine peptidase, partial [Planctomycetes bacterium]|nr:S8 family serine peptidase [Planctomycetota bacterium]
QLPAPNVIYYRQADLDPTQYPIDPATQPQINTFPGESHPLVVATRGVWRSSWEAALRAVDPQLQIVGSMPPYGVLVHAPIGSLSAIESLSFVQAVMYLDPLLKLAPRLGTSNPADVRKAEILTYEGFSPTRVVSIMNAAGITTTVTTISGRSLITADLDMSVAWVVAWFPEVEWIDDWDPGSTYNEKMRVLVQTDAFDPNANQGFYNPIHAMGVDGSTEIITIGDTGIETFHETLQAPGKVVGNYVPNGSAGTLTDEDGHGMAVVCTALGDRRGDSTLGFGTANDFDGLAVDAKLIMQDIGNDVDNVALPDDWITEMLVRAYDEGSRVQSSSWGHGNSNENPADGCYSFRSQLIDRFLVDPQHYDSVQVFAVGNLGGDEHIVPPAIPPYRARTLSDESHAKNAISVGAHRNGDSRHVMYTYSSRGPCNDGVGHGRVKPDLASVGSTLTSADEWNPAAYLQWFGTSHAAPVIAGAAALIRDWHNKGLYAGPPIIGEMSSALVKAMLINSTKYLGDPTAFLGNSAAGLPADGYPNYDQGYGRPVLDAVLDPFGHRQVVMIQDLTTDVNTGDRWTRTVSLKNYWPGASCNSMRVTLVWTDEPMTLSSGRALTNDLDLQVRFNGNKYIGNARHLQDGRFDDVNNVEDVLIPLETSTAGSLPLNFSIKVDVLGTSVFSTAAQPFAVVVTFGACRGTIPCVTLPPPCYPGPGDVIPTPNPPSNPCSQPYTLEEYLGEEPDPACEPGSPPISDPDTPTYPVLPGGESGL